MKKLLLSLAACAAMFSANAGSWMMGTTPFGVDTLYHYTSGPGMTTTGLKLSWTSDGVYSTNVHYTEVDLTNPNLEIRGVQAKDKYGAQENVKSMATRKTAQGNGQYLAGVNGDFFNMGAKVIIPLSANIADGKIYNQGSASNGNWGKWATHVVVKDKKDLVIGQNFKAGSTIIFPSKQTNFYHVNGGRGENELVIYTPDSITTNTNPWGSECKIRLVEGMVGEVGAVYEVTEANTGNNTTVPSDGFVLSGHGTGAALINTLAVGDRLTASQNIIYNGQDITNNNVTQAVGGCSMLVIDGKSAPDDYFSSKVVDHFPSSQARTAIGYNKDRTKLVMLVADKYSKLDSALTKPEKTTYDPEKVSWGTKSNGFFMYRMAQLMVNLDCYTAMAFDGGGSSQLYNKEFGVRNAPYGGTYLRPVTNGIFAVETTPVDNEIAMIEVLQKNVNLAADSVFTPTVLGYNQYGVLVSKNVKGFTLAVAPELGSVAGTAFTTGAAAGATKAVVTLGELKAGFNLTTNGGGNYVTSGDDAAPLQIKAPYTPDEPMGIDKEPMYLTEQWHFVSREYDDGWDGTAPKWDADSVKAKSCVRYATAFNGRFYTVDMVTMSIAEIDETGKLTPLYKLPSLEGRMVNDVPDYYGTAISSDDYGHFLVGHYFTKDMANYVWTVYDPKSGKAKHFDLESSTSSARIDNIGRVVGDLLSDAYVFVSPKGTGDLDTQHVNVIHFKGDGNIDNLTATNQFSDGIYMAGTGNTNGICQPKYETVSDMKGVALKDMFFNYSIAGGNIQYGVDLFNGASQNYALNWGNYSGLNGFDTFTLSGRRYFVVAFTTQEDYATNKNGQDIVVMSEDGMRVAEWKNPDYKATYGYNTITARKLDEQNVNIYVYNCTGNFNGSKPGAIAGALLRFSIGEFTPFEPVDITPEGLNFETYQDGDQFKVFSTETNGAWSGPANFYRDMHPTAFQDHGQLTSIMFRGQGSNVNNNDYVAANVQPGITVHDVEGVGRALVLTQAWSPATAKFGWPAIANLANQQFSFYMDPTKLANKTDKRHYVRVKIVYNALLRGCHYYVDSHKETPVYTETVQSIYATHDGNWVIPGNDYILGGRYAETGINFAKWENETTNVNDIPENPVVIDGTNLDDPWDAGDSHKAPDANGGRTYLMNPNRFRVYEFDTYMEPGRATSVQLNLSNRNITCLIHKIEFTDLGTDEADATLLGRRKLGWTYVTTVPTSIMDIVPDADAADAEPVYFNLQGVQVTNPENGIYIVRRGNTVTKEYIRK